MALKNTLPLFQCFSPSLANQTMTGTTVIVSPVSNIQLKDNIVYQMSWTGTPVGLFEVQVSLDYNPGLPQTDGAQANGTWTTLPALDESGAPPVASGSSGQLICELNGREENYIRMQYTNASGVGVLTGYVYGKSTGL